MDYINMLPIELINKIKYYVLKSPFTDSLEINKLYNVSIYNNIEILSCYNEEKNKYTELHNELLITDYEPNDYKLCNKFNLYMIHMKYEYRTYEIVPLFL